MMMKRSVVGAAVLAALTALAACGSEAEESEVTTISSSAKVIEITDQPGSLDDFVGALEDAEIQTCSTNGDGLNATGTVTNPEQSTQNYRIYLSALDGSDTVGLVQIDVADVPAGESADWNARVELGQEDLDCVLRVERYSS